MVHNVFFWRGLYKIERFPMNDDGPPKCPVCRSVFVRPRCTSAATAFARPAWWASTSTPNGTLANSPTTSARAAAKRRSSPGTGDPSTRPSRAFARGTPSTTPGRKTPPEYEAPKNIEGTDCRRWPPPSDAALPRSSTRPFPTLYEAARWEPSSSFPPTDGRHRLSRHRPLQQAPLRQQQDPPCLVAKDELTIDLVRDTTVVHEYVNPCTKICSKKRPSFRNRSPRRFEGFLAAWNSATRPAGS